jgi:hypothetical protein
MVAAVTVEGLKDFRRDLKQIDAALPKEMAKVHKAIAEQVLPVARANAAALGGMQRHFANQIRASGTQLGASISVQGKAAAAFWGSNQHSGWYAAPQYAGGPPQFKPWVGNAWEAGVPGEGPYAVNDAVAEMVPAIEVDYERMLDELTRKAFPV